MLATLCVASPLALVALGCSDPARRFGLRTLSFTSPSAIMGLILDMVVVSRDVEGVSCEELGWHINSFLLDLFTTLVEPCCFASLVATLWGYRAGRRSCVQPTSSRMISHRLPASSPTAEKKKR
jgi:hypothetical protein